MSCIASVMISTKSSPSTPCRPSISCGHRETTSPYFSGITSPRTSTSGATSDTGPDCSPSARKKRRTIAEESKHPDKSRILTQTEAAERDHIDNDTYLAHGVDLQLLKDPLYAFNLRKLMRLYSILWRVKPQLIQERVSDDPWKLLVAVILLNKTTGKQAIPVFWDLVKSWGSPELLSRAHPNDVKCLINSLGLHHTRSERLIRFSKCYVEDPPCVNVLRLTKVCPVPFKPAVGKVMAPIAKSKGKYPPTPISHLPGCGPYAFDSYRIFCMPGDEWKSIMPADKELIKYMKWKWAVSEQRRWDPVHGVLGSADSEYLVELAQHLGSSPARPN